MSETPEDATGPIPIVGTGPKVAFIGLGVMGGPMAGHLARADYRI
ncbi:MAG: NAD(P)-binding domain-containing protein, partial [Actinomycetota bacterium]